MAFPLDIARIRFDNAMLLFDEFVRATVKAPDDATLRGLERRFAERLQVQPSYWSQIKGRSRQIGERLARQFEQLCRKPVGWMDIPHAMAAGNTTVGLSAAPARDEPVDSGSQPQDDDERFIVGLVLTYYRRHPQRARTRLLDLLGEVLTPTDAGPAPTAPTAPTARTRRAPDASAAASRAMAPVVDDDRLWSDVQSRVAPLKRKR